MKRFSITVWLIFTSLLSFSVNAVDILNVDDFPKWFQDAMERENKLRKTSKIKIDDFKVNTKVRGKYKLVDDSDGTWIYHINIGSASPVECYIFKEFDGPATSLYSVLEYGLSGVETLNNLKMSAKFNYAIDSGVIGGTPFVSLDIFYVLGEGTKKVSGILKGIAARTEQSLQLCMHNEIGYRQTFFNVFESFVNAFIENEDNANFFEALYKVTINDIPMGYIQESYAKDGDGDISIVNETALLMPVDSSSVSRIDTSSTSWSSPDGAIINASEYSLQNGVLVSKFSLAYLEDAWQVEGELQGKAIKTKLEHTDWLLSGYGSYLVLDNLRNSEDDSGEYYMWAPGADPTSAIPVVLSKLNNDSTENFEIDMGAIVMKFFADEKGIFRQGTIAQGPMLMKMELIYSNGEPSP